MVRAVAAKLEAMEELDSGLLLRTSVTKVDRLTVILGTIKPHPWYVLELASLS